MDETYNLNTPDGDAQNKLSIVVPTGTGKDFKMNCYYSVQDTIGDVLEVISDATGLPLENISLFHAHGNSTFQAWEPISASITSEEPEVRLQVKALGGAPTKKSIVKLKQKTVSKHENLTKVKAELQKNTKAIDPANMACVKQADEAMVSFYTLAEQNPMNAFEVAIRAMTEADLVSAMAILDPATTGGNADYKMKKLSQILFKGMPQVREIYHFLNGILETADLTTSLAYDWGMSKDLKTDPNAVSMHRLRSCIQSNLDKRIGARESSAMAD